MEKIIQDMPRNNGDIVRIEFSEFKGQTRFNIRVWYQDEEGQYRPTKKGVSFLPEEMDTLVDAVTQAREAWQATPSGA